MSIEGPQKVDLSQDIEEQNKTLKLSDSQLKSYTDYLTKLEDTEKSEVMYLTQQELSELKSIIDTEQHASSPDPQAPNIAVSLKDFIQEQTGEGLSTSDILSGVEGINSDMEKLIDEMDELSHEGLFSEGGVLSALTLSDTAKDSISVSLTMAIMKEFSGLTSEQITIKTGEALLKLQVLKTVASDMISVGPRKNTPSLQISGEGDLNKIFLDANEGTEFFNQILSGTLSEQNIKSYIEERNIGEDEAQNIQHNIDDETIQSLVDKLKQSNPNVDAQTVENAISTAPVSSDQVEKPGEKNWLEEIIEKLMKFLEDFTAPFIKKKENDDNTDGNNSSPESDAENVAQTPALKAREHIKGKLDQGALSGINKESIHLLLDDDEKIQKLIDLVNKIPNLNGQDTFTEKMDNLLFSNIFTEDQTKMDSFMNEMKIPSIKNADNTLNETNFISAISKYKDYRIAYENEKGLTYKQYYEKTVS